MKQYKITDIEFDFECEDPPTQQEREVIIKRWMGAVIELDDDKDEDDIANYVSDRAGWLVQSVVVRSHALELTKAEQYAKAIAFQERTLESDNYRVTLEWLGEGHDGNYDPYDPGDEPLLRFNVHSKENDTELSYCTHVVAHTEEHLLDRFMQWLLVHAGSRRALEQLTWTTREDLLADHIAKVPPTEG